MFKENNSNYPISREFFLFSFVLFFLAYWILWNSSFDALSILPALVLGLGSSVLVYAVFSLVGWAPPLLDYFKFLKMPKLSLNLKAPTASSGFGRKPVKPVFLNKPKVGVLKIGAPKFNAPKIRKPKISVPKVRIGRIRKKVEKLKLRRKKYRR